MRRKKTHRRRWALWGSTIFLLTVFAVFAGESIGAWLGAAVYGGPDSDPFNFGGVSHKISGSDLGWNVGRSSWGNDLAQGDGISRPMTERALSKKPGWKKRYTPGTEQDAIGIQEALLAKKNIRIPPGDYLINIPLKIRSGQQIRAPGVRLIGTGPMAGGVILVENVEKVQLVGMTFVNLALIFKNAQEIQLSTVVFAHDISTRPGSAQLSLKSVGGDTVVENCRFIRQGQSNGIGLLLRRTQNVKIQNNSFMGAYVTAILVAGACPKYGPCNIGTKSDPKYAAQHSNRDLVIEKNKLHHNGLQKGAGFGISVWGAQAVALRSNRINGWPVSKRSACIKVGNSEDIQVLENRCDAGIFIVFDNTHPKYLRQITVSANTIRISPQLVPPDWPREYRGWLKGAPQRIAVEHAGIIVWRDFRGDPFVNERSETEISIRDNSIRNGTIRSARIRPGALTIKGNQAALCRWPNSLRVDEDNQCGIQEDEDAKR